MSALKRAREYFDRIDARSGPRDTVNLTATVGALLNELEERDRDRVGSTDAPTLSRVDALTMAREHVEAMSTGPRGYQDGVKLADKVSAVDTLARFLKGEDV
ncbi:hypothetical protein [Streptomyces scopuliridis]|uniref:Uncharacterized protein n=1 Tax=Streptomyces scopuliridis TaxID=452529 RepID=A0ACD4ZSG7_9ACTN|nr:hypothetical protein [Streptomyces scopuliridis]WSC01231.1 hypothetical protein OG835_32370 [Streptomyces scopuliridis]